LSFGGGGSAVGVTSHTHDSSAGNGGNLSSSITNLDTQLLQDNIRINALVFG